MTTSSEQEAFSLVIERQKLRASENDITGEMPPMLPAHRAAAGIVTIIAPTQTGSKCATRSPGLHHCLGGPSSGLFI
jgi:hypothetical protein